MVFAVLACLALVQGTAAFAIKYHFDLTENALQIEGFEGNSIGLVQSYNWMDDLAEQSGSTGFQGSAIKTLVYRGSGAMIQGSDISMHFDDLMDYQNVSAEWMRLENQTYAAVRTAESEDDVEGFLAVMGMSLHTVQDFYAHSNWVDLHWGGDATWFDVPESWKLQELKEGGEIYTHNSENGVARTHDRIHKDYTSRPDFEPAYRDAFYASLQWTELMRSWVSPEFWE
ncbi:MAG: hypothetical protein LUO86_07080, partial [Methanomicrobiales archaeon]|nr:hypothetical protein [Methanomicrobiales archaeon]